jgi:hypothetical protein
MIKELFRTVITWAGGKSGAFLDLTSDNTYRLRRYAVGVVRSGSVSYSKWAGHGRLYSRPEYKKMLERFMVYGWIAWVDPFRHTRGYKVTEAGRQAFIKLASDTTPLPLRVYSPDDFEWVTLHT